MLVEYFLYSLIAGVIASMGLLSNSMPAIIASMIISPLLGPIIKLVSKDRTYNNIYNSLIIVITITMSLIGIGFLIGYINNKTEYFHSESTKMKDLLYLDNKKDNVKLLSEFVIALFVAIGLPLSIEYNNIMLLTAFNIAPSITPPLANAGLYLANYLKYGNSDHYKAFIKGILLALVHIVPIVSILLIYKYYF